MFYQVCIKSIYTCNILSNVIIDNQFILPNFLILGLQGGRGWFSSPVVIEREVGYTLDSLPIHCSDN